MTTSVSSGLTKQIALYLYRLQGSHKVASQSRLYCTYIVHEMTLQKQVVLYLYSLRSGLTKQDPLYLYVLQRQVFPWSASMSLELGNDAHDSGEYTEYRRHSSVYTDTQVVTMVSTNSNIALN